MNYDKFFLCMSFLLTVSCSFKESMVDKNYDWRDNIIDVSKNIEEVIITDVMIGRMSTINVVGPYVLIVDYKSFDNLFHLFEKKTYSYVCSFGQKGQGPDEVVNLGHVAVSYYPNEIYINDHGKQLIAKYNLDSVVSLNNYSPQIISKTEKMRFLNQYSCYNDSMSIGVLIKPTGVSGYNQSLAAWNVKSSDITEKDINLPNVEKERFSVCQSYPNNRYVLSYNLNDLLVFCNFDDELVACVKGVDWSENITKRYYYSQSLICKNNLFALLSDENGISSRFVIFDLNGNYKCTLETKHNINTFCFDEDNSKLLMCLDDSIQFAALDILNY